MGFNEEFKAPDEWRNGNRESELCSQLVGQRIVGVKFFCPTVLQVVMESGKLLTIKPSGDDLEIMFTDAK
jgi:hypothetical protein